MFNTLQQSYEYYEYCQACESDDIENVISFNIKNRCYFANAITTYLC